MTKVLTIRLDHNLLGRAEARAAQLGLDRAKYVRALIEEDLRKGGHEARPAFASADLAGLYEGAGHPATNEFVRKQMRGRPRLGSKRSAGQ